MRINMSEQISQDVNVEEVDFEELFQDVVAYHRT